VRTNLLARTMHQRPHCRLAWALGVMAISLAILAFPSAGAAADCPLCGTWKSAASRSIAEMENTKGLSEKQRHGFRNLFGHLVVVCTSSHCRSYMDFQKTAEREPWKPYEILKRNGSILTLRDNTNGVWSPEYTITLYGECYTTPLRGYGFSEHFCRVPAQPH
jgi:hypothetical protein